MVGVNVSLSGNTLTVDSGTFQGSVDYVYGLVSGAAGPKGDKGDPGDLRGLNDAAVLNLAKAARVTGDRGKALGTSTTNQNELALLDNVTLVRYANQAAAEGATVGANVIQFWPES